MKEQKIEWVDVHNDDLMVSLGIRPANLEPKDPFVWTKNAKEKRILKRLRNRYKHSLKSGSVYTPKAIPVYTKLIILTKPSKRYTFNTKSGKIFYKTTFSTICGQRDIPRILSNYVSENGKNLVIKYYWNGKWYKATERPFWYGKN